MPDLIHAVRALEPKSQFSNGHAGYDSIIWHSKDIEKPTEEECNAKLAELQAEYNAQAYARSRATEYPSIQEQLDLQYWDKVNSTDKWGEAVKAVKDKYPKG